ncbi:Nicastrin-domain-containing protein [Mycotypha africana]|uniref:Nicastrin-domain-containing protein n=1 Tax=Mycotypha africana TaxID=64632 RepID=UPI0023014702|nr:Nicastrin-domain-containing protein [Mycotypha africana]KAI8971483.1 Nicastrin-domain-containing protein [Mycotypha africana]
MISFSHPTFTGFLSSVKSEDFATTIYPYIYTNLNNWPCVRLLNATGTVGCQSIKKKSGIIYHISSQSELDTFINNKEAIDDFALVIPFVLLTKANMDALVSMDDHKLAGLIVLLSSNQTRSSSGSALMSSPDSVCPNCEYGLYANDTKQYEWNPSAQGLLEQAFDFPIFAIKPEDDTVAETVYSYLLSNVDYNVQRQYKSYPLKAVEFDSFMWAAVNSETCLRRGWCQVVGGMSVFSSPSLNISAKDKKPIIVVSANMDSRSMFHDLTTGASSSISGLVTVLAIADTLSHAPQPLESLPKHILYTLFTAESWAFAGSQRFVKDISTPFVCTNSTRAVACPYNDAPCTFPCVRNLYFNRINFENIDSIFEFQSVSGINTNYSNQFFVHVDDAQQSQALLNKLRPFQNLKEASADGVQRKLPPSSAMSFLQKNRKLPAAVITDYQKELGPFYSSDLDDTLDLDKATHSICSLVSTSANAIYNQATNGNSSNLLSANCTLISSLLDCLISNFSCPFMQDYLTVNGISKISHSSSVLSFTYPQPQLLQRFVFSYLSDVTGKRRIQEGTANETVSCHTIKDCQMGEYCIKKKCTASFTTYHEAYGTGLQYDEVSGLIKVVDPSKGTWTESTWDTTVFRIFSVTSQSQQIIELIVGILWAILSVVAILFMKKYLKKTLKTE